MKTIIILGLLLCLIILWQSRKKPEVYWTDFGLVEDIKDRIWHLRAKIIDFFSRYF